MGDTMFPPGNNGILDNFGRGPSVKHCIAKDFLPSPWGFQPTKCQLYMPFTSYFMSVTVYAFPIYDSH